MERGAQEPGSIRGKVTRAAIVHVALEILAREGLARLTMRRVAERLGIEAASLYNHIRDKRDLLQGAAGQVLSAIPIPDESLPWADRMRRVVTGLYDALTAHPWLVTALAHEQVEPADPGTLGRVEAAMRVLGDAGLTPHQQVSAFRGMVALCLGLTLAHTMGLSMSPAEAQARFSDWDPGKWRIPEAPVLSSLAPAFLETKARDDLDFMVEAFVAALQKLGRSAAG